MEKTETKGKAKGNDNQMREPKPPFPKQHQDAPGLESQP